MSFLHDIFPIENEKLSPHEECLKTQFEVTTHTIDSLAMLLDKISHVGEFEYIRRENTGQPEWL
jgi:hypothetical protein